MDFIKSATFTVTLSFVGAGITEDSIREDMWELKRVIEDFADNVMSVTESVTVEMQGTEPYVYSKPLIK